jgi:hypothetical protein
MDQPNKVKSHESEARDADFHTGAVEDGKDDMINEQILPVFASTEPFGYEGSASDQQIVGGDDPNAEAQDEGNKGRSRQDFLGPGGD